VDIVANVAKYLGDRSRFERPASFDYCFNHFQGFRVRREIGAIADPVNVEVSCLHLGYYLASWGMLRGSTILHTKSYRFFEPVIQVISKEDPKVWGIDAHCYTDKNISQLLGLGDRISSALATPSALGVVMKVPTDTLVTKVMLGVFGSIPAFDTFFKIGFRKVTQGPVKVDRQSLRAIGDFYHANASVVDQSRVRTLNFATGKFTRHKYSRAKMIDMVFLIEGGGS
jgi:hypothetical protein